MIKQSLQKYKDQKQFQIVIVNIIHLIFIQFNNLIKKIIKKKKILMIFKILKKNLQKNQKMHLSKKEIINQLKKNS